MKFLALDTAGTAVEVVSDDGKFFRDENGRHASEALLPAVDAALTASGRRLSDLDYIACVIGPGSFTGIRIGVSAVRSLCYASGKPALGLHALTVLAYHASADGFSRILALRDASNGFVYLGEYDGDRRELAPARVVRLQEALETASRYDGAVCVDEALATHLPQAFAPAKDGSALRRAAIASAASAGDYASLVPLYVRESQAEQTLREHDHGGQ